MDSVSQFPHRITPSAARLLAETGLTVTEIALSTGFNTPSYFTKAIKQLMRCTPSQNRRKNGASGSDAIRVDYDPSFEK